MTQAFPLGLMLCYDHLKVLNNFKQRIPCVRFALDPIDPVAGLAALKSI